MVLLCVGPPILIHFLDGGLVAIFYFPIYIYMGISHHPLIDELIFFRGVAKNHQPGAIFQTRIRFEMGLR